LRAFDLKIDPMQDYETFGKHIVLAMSSTGTATVTIDRPEKRNALSLEMWQGLAEAFAMVDKNTSIRAVILKGEGGHFCSGADIGEFDQVRYDSRSASYYDSENDRAAIAIRDCRKPVIAALSGSAVGGGLGIALACDFRTADRSIKTGIPAAKLAVLYSIFDCTLLHSRVGSTNAKEILFSGRLFGLNDAVRLGLVDRIAEEPGSAFDAATAFATEFLAAAPLSIHGHKTILAAIDARDVELRRSEIESLIAAAFDSQDYREGRRAFLERRPPNFTGR
jgi:enoyl-CoA hydratase/carnithine racemase